jgi:hypothetical protein
MANRRRRRHSTGHAQPIHGPPEFVRAAEMQRAYWTPNAEALSQLEAHRVDPLDWRALLRRHHLICLQRLEPGVDRGALNEKCRQTVRRRLADDSPNRPRPAAIWQRQAPHPDADREPDMQGELLSPCAFANASARTQQRKNASSRWATGSAAMLSDTCGVRNLLENCSRFGMGRRYSISTPSSRSIAMAHTARHSECEKLK